MAVDFSALVLAPCMDTFGIPVIYRHQDTSTENLLGIFDSAYEEVTVIDGVPMTQIMPVLGINLSDLTQAPVQHDEVTIQGSLYVVREVRIDSHGGCKLMLNFRSGMQ